jgi:hypothetical protein
MPFQDVKEAWRAGRVWPVIKCQSHPLSVFISPANGLDEKIKLQDRYAKNKDEEIRRQQYPENEIAD